MYANHMLLSTKTATVATILALALLGSCGDDVSETSRDGESVIAPSTTLTMRIQSHATDFLSPPPNWGPRAVRGPVRDVPAVQSIDLALRADPVPLEPVADVQVALDRPDGTRLGESTSDAEGLVVFELAEGEWPVDVALSATAYHEDYVMHTLTGVVPPSSTEPLPITIQPRWEAPTEDRVLVEGRTRNRQTSGNGWLFVTSTAPYGTWFERQSSTWALRTLRGVPFDVVAFNYFYTPVSSWDYDLRVAQAARVSSDGLDDDSVIDIDFEADAVVPTDFEGSFALPSRPSSPLLARSSRPTVLVRVAGSYWSGFVGFQTRLRLEGSVVEYGGVVVKTPEYGGNWYLYWVETGGSGGQSYAFGRGVPDGAQPQLLDLPEWVSVDGQRIDEPLSWEIFDEGVRPMVWIRSPSGEVIWQAEVPEDATSVTLPAPPSNVDLAGLLGRWPRALIVLDRQIDGDEGVFWLVSWGDELELTLELGE